MHAHTEFMHTLPYAHTCTHIGMPHTQTHADTQPLIYTEIKHTHKTDIHDYKLTQIIA